MNWPDGGRSSLVAYISRLALLLALVVGTVPPAAFFGLTYVRLKTELEGNLHVQSVALTDFAAAQPETWDVASDRMLEALDRFVSYEKGFRVRKITGEVLYDAPPRVSGPFVSGSRVFYSFGRPVGVIDGQESLRCCLGAGSAVLFVSLVGAWLLWGPMRRLPLNALAEAERELRAQDRYQRALFNNFPFMVWLKDVDSRYRAVNSKFLEYSGRRSEVEVLGGMDAGMGPPGMDEKLRADDRAVLESGQAKRIEEWIERGDERRCLEIYKSPVWLDGAVIGTVGYAQDITSRKKSEQKLTETLRLLEETQALSHFGGWEYDIEAHAMTWSSEVYRLHGVAPDFDVNDGEKLLSFYPPVTAKLVAEAFSAAVRHGVPFDLDVQFQPLGGGKRWVRIMGTPQFSGSRIVCVHGNFMDITEKKTMELQLQLANEMLEQRVQQRTQELAAANRSISQILSAVSSILFVLDTEGRVTTWNAAAQGCLLDASADPKGAPLGLLRLGMDATPLAEGITRCRVEKQPVKIHNLRYKDCAGKEGFLTFTLSPILDEHGEFGGVLCLGDDITDLKFLETKLAQAQRLESIGQLAAGIAHEINTPVQFIGDSMSFLLDAFKELKNILDLCTRLKADGQMSEDSHQDLVAAIALSLHDANYEYLEREIPKSFTRAFEGIERVTTIVQAMKRFSHPGGQDKRAVDINKAVENTLTVSHNEWKYVADGVTNLSPELPPVICLPGDLNQVLLNVIVNAAHAIAEKVGRTGGKGRITVTTGMDGDDVVIAIADTGTGIPAAVRDKIFDPFFTTKEVGKGTGQGLAIAYDIVVNKHGGTLTFDSREGEGSTFYIRLPIGG